jgi:hypothetical protein
MDRDPAVQALIDRQLITDTLHRYASSIDGHDFTALRSVFADDAAARYGDRDWMTGADEIVDWIAGYARLQAWQHHLVSVYHIDIDGDAARAVTYHSCHQAPLDDPGDVTTLIGQYRDELRRDGEHWRVTRREMEVSWRGSRSPGPSATPAV